MPKFVGDDGGDTMLGELDIDDLRGGTDFVRLIDTTVAEINASDFAFGFAGSQHRSWFCGGSIQSETPPCHR